MTEPDIFSRATRRRFRDRAFASDDDSRWLTRFMMTELVDRLELIKRKFDRVLIIGNNCGDLQKLISPSGSLTLIADPSFYGAANGNGVQCDEDRLPFANASFDLVLVLGGLDTVNDLPGALVLIRRILIGDGLFLGAMVGAGSLEALRNTIMCITEPNRIIARHHPQIDVRGAGDLLTRAGFTQPVTDSHHITAKYPDLYRLINDLRANAMTNALVERQPLRRDQVAQMAEHFAAAGNPKTEEIFSLIFMTGWAPPARAPIAL